MKASRCTFLDHRKSAVEAEEAAARPTLVDCLIAPSGQTTAAGNFDGGDTTIIRNRAGDLGIADSKQLWDGVGDAMNSSIFAGKGYRSR